MFHIIFLAHLRNRLEYKDLGNDRNRINLKKNSLFK